MQETLKEKVVWVNRGKSDRAVIKWSHGKVYMVLARSLWRVAEAVDCGVNERPGEESGIVT